MSRRGPLFSLLTVAVVTLLSAPASATHGGDREVTVGSADAVFSQNKQNEPAVVVDPINPNVLVAGANDNIDMEACNAGDDTTCPFTPNVGGTGVQFSFDQGDSWIQPEYTGWTARHCLGAPGGSDDPPSPDSCEVEQGPIGTLPRYDDVGLVSDGDPALAFGPRPGPGGFSWANGSRLYMANLTSKISADLGEPHEFKGFEAIAVSRTDNVPAAAAGVDNAWKKPVIASKQSSATFADKEQIWADNASSSEFFGHVYVCYASFTGFGAAPLVVSTSRDGGATWATKQVSPAHNVSPKHFGQSGCTIRTDSQGTVYVFYEEFQEPSKFSPPAATHMMVRSFNGGIKWTRPQVILKAVDPCFRVDPVIQRCVMDGIGGARSDLAAAPSVSIANGAPFGTRNGQPNGPPATDLIVNVWVDGRDGLNQEDVMVSYSGDRGTTWSTPLRVSAPSDRGFYAAPALSPDGRDLYVVYNAFTTPFRETTSAPRLLVGVVLHFDIAGNGAPINRVEVHRGPSGEARGSSQNDLQAEFLGDYVYATATNDYGAAVWQDARNTTNCPAIDAWRMSLRTEDESDDVDTPAPQQDCPATFGNTDIFGWSGADPTAP